LHGKDLISTVSEIAKTTAFRSACNKLKIPFLGEDNYEFAEKKFGSPIEFDVATLVVRFTITQQALQILYITLWKMENYMLAIKW